jgi:hypothetical protein
LANSSGRYKSSFIKTGLTYTWNIDIRILSDPPGSLSIITLDYSAKSTVEPSFMFRLSLASPIVKTSSEIFNLSTTLSVEWIE